MATISSPGIGSGLDIRSIVSQLIALEKQPLTAMKVQAATVEAKISSFGQTKSMVSALSDAASTLNSLTTFNAVATTSSNTAVATATSIGGTAVNSFSVKVDSLAKAQSTASAALLPVGGALGAGTLRLQLGRWTVVPASFTPQVGVAPVDITVSASDTITDVASKINGAKAGVSATVLNDASGQRLLLRSTSTGEAAGFQLSVLTDADGVPTDSGGLSRAVVGTTVPQYGADAKIQVNGIPVSSATNIFNDVVSGVTVTAVAPNDASAEVTVAPDRSAVANAISKFVTAYNAINDSLNEQTKYDPATKAAGLLQGDPFAIGLQNALRGLLQSTTAGSAYKRLADIGITQALGGDLMVDNTKLTAAQANGDEVKKLFKADNGNAATNGVAVKFKAFTAGLLSVSGLFSSTDASLKRSLAANARDQGKLNAKITRDEAALNQRYSALDVQLSSLNALNAYVVQQVKQWNKA